MTDPAATTIYTECHSQEMARGMAFTYRPPLATQPARYVSIRQAANDFAKLLNESCPRSRELSLAMTNLEQVVMWGNASIARNE